MGDAPTSQWKVVAKCQYLLLAHLHSSAVHEFLTLPVDQRAPFSCLFGQQCQESVLPFRSDPAEASGRCFHTPILYATFQFLPSAGPSLLLLVARTLGHLRRPLDFRHWCDLLCITEQAATNLSMQRCRRGIHISPVASHRVPRGLAP